MFRELGPDTRTLLEAIASFSQDANENNSVSGMIDIPNKFCVLSMTYRSKSFVKMPGQLRGHLYFKDPKSSTLLCMTKERHWV